MTNNNRGRSGGDRPTPKTTNSRNHTLESIMTEKQTNWQQANQQIAQLAKIKNSDVRSRQIVLICESLKRAMGAK